jgi:4-fold beta flower protein
MQTKSLTRAPAGEDPRQIRRGATDNAEVGRSGSSWGHDMEDAIYAKSGAPIGFHVGKIIYDLQGQPIGQLRGARVYCMGGHYFGELKNGVIFDKRLNCAKSAISRARGNPGMRNHGSQPIRSNPRQ